jgi:hypothetical protein
MGCLCDCRVNTYVQILLNGRRCLLSICHAADDLVVARPAVPFTTASTMGVELDLNVLRCDVQMHKVRDSKHNMAISHF